MPELPDVEGFRALLAEHATGHQVERVDVADAGVLRGITAMQLDDGLLSRLPRVPALPLLGWDTARRYLAAHAAAENITFHEDYVAR
jgi:formamidopyrimidine-DNA glycosylase